MQAKQVGVTVRPHWSSLRLLLRTYERWPCSKSTIRGNLPQVCPYVPSYLNLFLCFRRIFFYFHPLNDSDSFVVVVVFFSRTRISQFITGSTYTVFTFGVELWVKWKATESLILLFIPWYRPSSVQLSKLTHVHVELFKEAEHSFSSNSLSLYCVWEHLYHEEICSQYTFKGKRTRTSWLRKLLRLKQFILFSSHSIEPFSYDLEKWLQ